MTDQELKVEELKIKKIWKDHIAVSPEMKKQLNSLKFKYECTSYDELLNKLLDELEAIKNGYKN